MNQVPAINVSDALVAWMLLFSLPEDNFSVVLSKTVCIGTH